MTHQLHPNIVHDVVELLSEHGFDGMAQGMQLLLNESMKIERQAFLGVGPYQRGRSTQRPSQRLQAQASEDARWRDGICCAASAWREVLSLGTGERNAE